MSRINRVKPLAQSLSKDLTAQERRDILNGIEVWKEVPRYEEFYHISSFGRFKRMERKQSFTNSLGYFVERTCPEKIRVDSVGVRYQNTSLYDGVNKESSSIHRIMVEVFFGVVTDSKTVVDHLDNNGNNNHIENLQVVSSRYNSVKYTKATGGHSSKYTGVSWHIGINKWIAVITTGRKKKHLLSSDSEEECNDAYQAALMNLNN